LAWLHATKGTLLTEERVVRPPYAITKTPCLQCQMLAQYKRELDAYEDCQKVVRGFLARVRVKRLCAAREVSAVEVQVRVHFVEVVPLPGWSKCFMFVQVETALTSGGTPRRELGGALWLANEFDAS